jgi:NitT/TauT family transport system substrate-binding protein
LETLARAASRGAPVNLLAVTVWRKFYFVTAPLPLNRDGSKNYPPDVATLLAFAADSQEVITSAPQNSPSAEILNKLKDLEKPFLTEALSPQQLMLELSRGQRNIALLPEPLATQVVTNNKNLKILGSLEVEHARRFGGEGLMPQAGVAVNSKWAIKNPDLVHKLLDLMVQTVNELKDESPAQKADLLPPEVHKVLSSQILENSLALEPLIIKPASQVKKEISDYLTLAAPDITSHNEFSLIDSFIWKPLN